MIISQPMKSRNHIMIISFVPDVAIIEFVNDDLGKLQEHISKKYNFTLESHDDSIW